MEFLGDVGGVESSKIDAASIASNSFLEDSLFLPLLPLLQRPTSLPPNLLLLLLLIPLSLSSLLLVLSLLLSPLPQKNFTGLEVGEEKDEEYEREDRHKPRFDTKGDGDDDDDDFIEDVDVAAEEEGEEEEQAVADPLKESLKGVVGVVGVGGRTGLVTRVGSEFMVGVELWK